MAFNIVGFKTVDPGGAIGTGEGSVKNLHHYVTNDTLAVVEAANYFDSAADYLNAGDTIIVTGDVDGTIWTQQYAVASVSAAGVVVVTGSANKTFNSKYALTVEIEDISTAGQSYVVPPIAGTVEEIYSVINGAIGTADATLTAKINGTAITDGAITVANAGSAAGDVDQATPSAANTVAAGDALEIETDGASTNTVKAFITFLISPT